MSRRLVCEADMTMPFPPPVRPEISPQATLPPGLTDPPSVRIRVLEAAASSDRLAQFVARRMDDHFAPKAARLSADMLRNCRVAIDAGCHLLSFEYAKAAAHWRRVDEDYRSGVELVEVPEFIDFDSRS